MSTNESVRNDYEASRILPANCPRCGVVHPLCANPDCGHHVSCEPFARCNGCNAAMSTPEAAPAMIGITRSTTKQGNPGESRIDGSAPDVEVFHYSKMEYLCAGLNTTWSSRLDEVMADGGIDREDAAAKLSGWYWWSCFPGCPPDSDPHGPFDTEALALADAQDIGD